MLQGRIALNNPSLNVRPEFQSQVSQPGEQSVCLFDTTQAPDLTEALQDTCDLTLQSARTLESAYSRYAKLKAEGDEAAYDALSESQTSLTGQWSELVKNHSKDALRITTQMISQASSHLGPVLMAGMTALAPGVVRVELREQSSKSGIIGPGSELAFLTGDHYSNRQVDGGIRGGEVLVARPILGEKVAGSLLIDTQRGLALLEQPASLPPA